MADAASRNPRDILSNVPLAAVFFWLPIAAIVVSGQIDVGLGWRTAIWTLALVVMGTGCAINAARCGRLHCYFSAPFFFAMAVVTGLYGWGVLPLGLSGWNWISGILLAGGLLVVCVPEHFLGKYREGRPAR
jgi:hypothetical protein